MHQLVTDSLPKWDSVIEHYKTELKSLRSNRAHPSMVEDLKISYYDTPTPLQQVATITSPEPRQLMVEPWDKQALKDIEAGLNGTDMGFSVKNDGTAIRLSLPDMTEENRKQTVTLLNKKTEEARVGVRKVREEVLKSAKTAKEASEIAEDEFFKIQKEVQDHVDSLNADIKSLAESKEKEILSL
ncbi:MAG: ribosome recycling factor [Patescibacteria group bacterium]